MPKPRKQEFVLPTPPLIPFELPPSNYAPLTPLTPKKPMFKNKQGKAGLNEDNTMLINGEVILKEDLLTNDFRNLAEFNERIVLVKNRALLGMSVDKVSDDAIQKFTQKVDDPLKDQRILTTFGWLLNLETSNTFLRILSINRRSMAGLALFYKCLGGPDWYPIKWPTFDRKINENTLPGLDVTYAGVTEITLRENNLKGTLPRDLTNGLHSIIKLDLSKNKDIVGGIPSCIGTLESLEYLDFSGCGLSGYLPAQLCLLLNLKYLDLSNNKFIGELFSRMVDLKKLEHLDLSKNGFTGKLPRSWSRVKYLKVFAASFNKLHGTVPDEWESLTTLEYMDIRCNDLSGPVPNAVLSLLNSKKENLHSGAQGGSSNGMRKKSSVVTLQECRLRGNHWDSTILRFPHGILLNRSTDLALVDLPGTPYMTSRQDAKRLLHKVTLYGDVLPPVLTSNENDSTAAGRGGRDSMHEDGNSSVGFSQASSLQASPYGSPFPSAPSSPYKPLGTSAIDERFTHTFNHTFTNFSDHDMNNTSKSGADNFLDDNNDLNMISGGAEQLLNRTLRPATASSPRVVARVTARYQPLLRGGEKVLNGFQALYLEPAELKCELCSKLYSACLCVTLCQACGQYSKKEIQNHHQLSKQSNKSIGHHKTKAQFSLHDNTINGKSVTRGNSIKSDGSKKSPVYHGGNREQVGGLADVSRQEKYHKTSIDDDEINTVKCKWCGLSEKQGFKYKAAHTAYIKDHNFNEANLSNNLYTSALLYPPKPNDLLKPPTSHSMDVSDPFSDHFPF